MQERQIIVIIVVQEPYSRSSTSSSYLQERARHKQPIFFQFRQFIVKKIVLKINRMVWRGSLLRLDFFVLFLAIAEGRTRRYRLGILRRLARRESVQVTRSQQIAGLGNIIVDIGSLFAITQPYFENQSVISHLRW